MRKVLVQWMIAIGLAVTLMTGCVTKGKTKTVEIDIPTVEYGEP